MRLMLPLKLALLALLSACVTVNVYFPAAAAEKAADQIIDSVTGQSGSSAPQSSSKPQGQNDRSPQTSLNAPQPARVEEQPGAAFRETRQAESASLLAVTLGRA